MDPTPWWFDESGSDLGEHNLKFCLGHAHLIRRLAGMMCEATINHPFDEFLRLFIGTQPANNNIG